MKGKWETGSSRRRIIPKFVGHNKTHVENRVTNHKGCVYNGGHWPWRIIDGHGRCRVSIRPTIETKRGTDRESGLDHPPLNREQTGGLRSPFCVLHPRGTRFDYETISASLSILRQLYPPSHCSPLPLSFAFDFSPISRALDILSN